MWVTGDRYQGSHVFHHELTSRGAGGRIVDVVIPVLIIAPNLLLLMNMLPMILSISLVSLRHLLRMMSKQSNGDPRLRSSLFINCGIGAGYHDILSGLHASLAQSRARPTSRSLERDRPFRPGKGETITWHMESRLLVSWSTSSPCL